MFGLYLGLQTFPWNAEQGPLVLTGYGLANGSNLGPYFYQDSYQLAWTPSPGASGYEVYMASYTGTLDSGDFTLQASTEGLTYSVNTSSIWNNTSYFKLAFKVVALTVNEESNIIEGITANPAPSPSDTYLRPGGIDNYLRPGGTNIYIRP